MMNNSEKQPLELPEFLPLVDVPGPPLGRESTAALAWAMIVPLVGLILSIRVLIKAKKADTNSRKGLMALIISGSLFALETASFVLIILAFSGALNTPFAQAYYQCGNQDDKGMVVIGSTTFNCDDEGVVEQVK